MYLAKLLSLVVIVLFSSTVFSQKDSFSNKVKEMTLLHKKEVNFVKAYFYFEKKEWDSSLVYSMRQLQIETNSNELNNYCSYIRGLSFMNKGLFSAAKKELSSISKSFQFYYRVKIAFGMIALQQSDYTTALRFFESVNQQPNANFDFTRSTFYQNLGLCYFHTQNFGKAEKYLLKSSALQLADKDTLKLVGTYMDLANLYYEQFNDDQAIPYFEKAYQLSKKVNSFELKRNAAENMAVVEENRKNLSKALTFRKEMEQWKDSLNDQNKVWAIAQLEKKHAVQQKQKEITLLEAENKIKIARRTVSKDREALGILPSNKRKKYFYPRIPLLRFPNLRPEYHRRYGH